MKNNLVAIVDDEVSVRVGLQRLLRAAGFAVEEHGSATDFLNSLHRGYPDCLLLDIHMPGLNGFELLEALRSMGAEMPVIVLSANCSPPVVRRVTSLGALQCLSKPVDASTLTEAIRVALHKPKR